MPKPLFFATGNPHKLREIKEILGEAWDVKSIADLSEALEVEETAETLEGNAELKAKALHAITGVPCFADDTGLEVEALGNAPGVRTARYAGPKCDADDNMNKLLGALRGKDNRKAQFRTAVAYFDGDSLKLFEGILSGHIATSRSGKEGFGYDPIFIPEGDSRTLAEHSSEEKNAISHRGKAIRAFIDYLTD